MTTTLTASRNKDTKQTMLLGLAKSPLPGADPLATLALVAMRTKFERRRPPAGPVDAGASYLPSGNYLSDESRSQLLKLFSAHDAGSEWPTVGLFRAIKAHGLKLHPFDYVRLEFFIAEHAAELGPEERAWLAVVRPAKKQEDVYLDTPLTDATLPQASRPQKLQFLRALRQEDATKARELIEALVPNEPANIRAELVGLLAVYLSEADRPFLERLMQDRAQSVRDAVGELLGGIRGTEAFAKRIDRLKDHVRVKTEGLIRKHRVLKYAGPGSSNAHDMVAAQRALLKDLRLKDIADALGVSEQDLLEVASRSQEIGILPRLLLFTAVKEGLLELAARHIALLDDEDHSVIAEFLAETWPAAPPDKRDRILRLAIRPKSWVKAPGSNVLIPIWHLVGTPLPMDLASEVIESTVWTDDGGQSARMSSVAPLIPRALSARFIEKFEAFAPCAALYHRFLLSLPERDM